MKVPEQICNACKLPKPLDVQHYHKDKQRNCKFNAICIECKHAQQKEKRDRIRAEKEKYSFF